MSKLVENVIS